MKIELLGKTGDNLIFITGGLGYLGGRIAEHLINCGHSIRLGTRTNISNLAEVQTNADISVVDMEDKDSLVKATLDVDTIIHLASPDAKNCELNKTGALQVKGIGALNLLEAAEINKVKNLIYFSSAHVYGVNLKGFVDENSIPRPNSSYGITHLLAENYFLSAFYKTNINSIILRLSNSFGRPSTSQTDCWQLVINDFCKQCVENKKIILLSDGTQQRDFIAMENVCEAVDYFINFDYESNNIEFPVFNVGGNKTLTIFDAAKIVAQRYSFLFGGDIQIVRGAMQNTRKSDGDELVYSSNKLATIGFNLKERFIQEVDEQLTFCNKNFIRK